jgi:hypothetical protein
MFRPTEGVIFRLLQFIQYKQELCGIFQHTPNSSSLYCIPEYKLQILRPSLNTLITSRGAMNTIWTEDVFRNVDRHAVTIQELFEPSAYMEKWPLFLPFSCFIMQMHYQKQNLI